MFGEYTGFILASYGITAVVLAWLGFRAYKDVRSVSHLTIPPTDEASSKTQAET
jgi:hypothetical protein